MANIEETNTIEVAGQQGNVHTPSTNSHVGDSLEGIGLTPEKALSKTGGAEISFFYFQKYEEELRSKNDEFVEHLESQRKDFQKQLESEREASVKQLDSQRKELEEQLGNQRLYWEKKLQTKEDEIKDLNQSVIELSISNGFCRSLKWVNIIGAVVTLVGTTGSSLAAANGLISLVILLSLVAILGALFPQIITWLSEKKQR